MKKLTIGFALLLLTSVNPAHAKAKKNTAAMDISTLEIIEKVNDHWQQNHKPEVRSFWDEAAYFTGNMEAYKLTDKAAYLEYSDKWARFNKWQGARGTDKRKWKYKNYGEGQDYVLFGDWQICFQTYLDIYEMNPDAYKIARAKEVMDYECAMTANDFWWWADALYMVMPVMTKLYKATGDIKYLDKLYENFSFADSLMFDKEVGLYYRDGKYIYPKHTTANGKKDFWARGDGWVLAGLAKVLTDMPKDYRHYDFFKGRFLQLAAAVAKCQQKEGYWSRSMLDAKHAPGYETSGTSFFTYGLLWGMNHGLLDHATYAPIIDKAWKYLTKIALQSDGTIGYVQPIGEKAIPDQKLGAQSTSNFGVGAFLLAACEKVRYDNQSVNPSDNKVFTFEVRNDDETQRNEVVELDAEAVFSRLAIDGGRQFVIRDNHGMEVPYQLTYDKKIILQVSVRPCGAVKYTICKGVPKVYVKSVYGRMFPERKDDMAWENDRGAYRMYGPALQRTGERSFGTDVWVKNTPSLVLEQRYRNDDEGNKLGDKLMKQGRKDEADAVDKATSFHLDHGNGLDCYSVGATLGCGAPAVMDGDKMIMPYCYDSYQLLDNGPLRFTVLLKYKPTTIKGCENVIEHRLISLDKGSNFNKLTVWYDGLRQPFSIASGVVLHSEDTTSVVLTPNTIAYADPTDNYNGTNGQLYVGMVYPSNVNMTTKIMYPRAERGNAGHAVGIWDNCKDNERHTYYFGSAWSKYDCYNMNEWQTRISTFQKQLDHPLDVEFK